jgi:glycosyltransferase involved in cell wall biosynthesis
MPLSLKKYQWYIMLMPSATESYNLKDYDVIVSSSSAFSKGVITRPDAIHICYCHTPTRYLWSDTHSYLQELQAPKLIKSVLPPMLSRLRLWDKAAAERVDHFLANSETVKHRIKKYYRKQSSVIYPPVDISSFYVNNNDKSYFLIGGRLVAYKKYDLVIEAFNKTRLPLKIFGSGPIEQRLRKIAGPSIEFVGRVNDEQLANLYANCRAFLHPHEEDFGITAIEAMASGRPVIAYRRGGATETVTEGITGEFFDEQSWEEIADHVIRFNDSVYDSKKIREHAEKFDSGVFKENLKSFVEMAWEHRQRVD